MLFLHKKVVCYIFYGEICKVNVFIYEKEKLLNYGK